MGYSNNMTILLNKIERRLGTKPLNLPDAIKKDQWADIIKEDTLPTFSRFFPHKFKYYVDTNKDLKGDYYLIDENVVNGLTILGIRDINWESFSSDSNILQGNQGYGVYDFLSQNYGLDDIGMLQMRADHVSMFNRGIYPIFEYPNKIQLKTATGANITKGLDRFPIDLLIQHPDNLTTISPTKMEIFEELAKADVAVFLYEYLKHYDGLETVFANVDLKLSSIETAANKRDDIVTQLKESYVSSSNDAQPIWLCV